MPSRRSTTLRIVLTVAAGHFVLSLLLFAIVDAAPLRQDSWPVRVAIGALFFPIYYLRSITGPDLTPPIVAVASVTWGLIIASRLAVLRHARRPRAGGTSEL